MRLQDVYEEGLKSLHWRHEEDCNQQDDGGSRLAATTPEGPFLDVKQLDPI